MLRVGLGLVSQLGLGLGYPEKLLKSALKVLSVDTPVHCGKKVDKTMTDCIRNPDLASRGKKKPK